ncbi:protein TolB [Streptomyces sp. NPDC050704]|uniref:WD40 repeat domain-containing protein n=1 Tax=Streptomyces sp. NPDC050704 TaxID=3157219 RepID=UPI003449054A
MSALLAGALGTTALPATTAHAAPTAPPVPRVERVSVAADGTEGNAASGAPSITRNGRYVAFRSAATNLTTPGPGQDPRDRGYVRDLKTGEVTRVKGTLGAPVVSDDGRYAAHIGWGSHAVNVFLTDLSTGERRRIDGNGFKEGSSAPSISADGRYIAYGLAPQHPADPHRVEVYDRVTDTREVVSDGPPDSTRDMADPSISADGSRVAYEDAGTDQVWVRDRTTGSLTRVDDGTPSTLAQISGNGRTVAMNSADGAYVRDLRTGEIQRVAGGHASAVSPDGRQLLYGDGQSNLRLRNLRTGHEIAVGHGGAGEGAIAGKGRGIVYATADADVVPGDTNGVNDVFKWTVR